MEIKTCIYVSLLLLYRAIVQELCINEVQVELWGDLKQTIQVHKNKISKYLFLLPSLWACILITIETDDVFPPKIPNSAIFSSISEIEIEKFL